MIEVRDLTKRYGGSLALDRLSFQVRPGVVTGFLGPNGAGKTTCMRVLLGLAAPTSGEALVNGGRYAGLRRPLHEVGALLDASAVHGGRTAYDHLRCLALTHRIGSRRVAAVLESVGLAGVARKRVGEFSLGMRQRLGIAAALLGDPGVLVLDEPVNGLDPDGVRWIRELVRTLAAEGRTVLMSSHLMGETAVTADRLVIVARGRLVAETSVAELADRFGHGVLVRTPRPAELAGMLTAAGAAVARADGTGELLVRGLGAERIGDIASAGGVPLHGMTARGASLEEAYLELTASGVEHRSGEAGR
ncbi:ABC transporter ATP-binding protein [Spirillospora sp. NPDC050679]